MTTKPTPATPYVTPLVRKLAAQHGIDLNSLTGTGAGGRITANDVRARAPKQPRAITPTRPVSLPGARREVVNKPSVWNGHSVDVDAFARNPLLDDAQQSIPAVVAAARAEGAPVPTLFMAGDLPVMMASGMDPALLLQLPWQARHAAAAADAAGLSRMLEDYGRRDSSVMAEIDQGGHVGNRDYQQRMSKWLSGETPEAAAARQRARQESEPSATDLKVYDSMYGAMDAERERKEKLRAEQQRIQQEAKRAAADARHKADLEAAKAARERRRY